MIQYIIISAIFLIAELIFLQLTNPITLKIVGKRYPVLMFISQVTMAILWPLTLLGIVFTGITKLINKGEKYEKTA